MTKEKMNIRQKLGVMQQKLKAPKDQNNDFAHFKYRSAEDILEAVKPFLLETLTIIVTQSKMVLVGDRYYIKTVAELIDSEGDEKVSAIAYAREQVTKKGMDESQITGSTISYSKKYALANLLAIDDGKDADTDAHAKQVKNAPVAPVAPAPKITLMQKMSGSIMDAKDQPALDEIIAWLGENAKSFTGKQLEELQNLIDEKREGFTR